MPSQGIIDGDRNQPAVSAKGEEPLLVAVRCRSTEDSTGKSAGSLIVLDEDLAVDHDGLDAHGTLYDPPLSARQVVDELPGKRSDRRGVEQHKVGGQALADQAAVGDAHEVG